MQKELTDEQWLLVEIAKGNQLAFGKLFNFYKDRVYGYALAILHTETLSEEVLQNVFLKVWLKRAELTSILNFGGFLRVVVKNECLNALKKIAIEKKNYTEVGNRSEILDFSTENAIQFRETERILDAAIEKLPPKQKIVYQLCHVEGLKQKDVADQLHISPLTVKAHLRDAMKSIKTYLHNHQGIKNIAFLLVFLK